VVVLVLVGVGVLPFKQCQPARNVFAMAFQQTMWMWGGYASEINRCR
jgi:hypothetical protein